MPSNGNRILLTQVTQNPDRSLSGFLFSKKKKIESTSKRPVNTAPFEGHPLASKLLAPLTRRTPAVGSTPAHALRPLSARCSSLSTNQTTSACRHFAARKTQPLQYNQKL